MKSEEIAKEYYLNNDTFVSLAGVLGMHDISATRSVSAEMLIFNIIGWFIKVDK